MTAESVHFRVGDFSCVAFADALETLTETDIENMFGTDAERMVAAFRTLTSPLTFGRNILLVDTGEKRVLIDTGMGQANPDDPGHLLDRMRAEQISPESIDTVVITHYHGDHIVGLTDNAGNPTFPNARLVVPSEEHGYWMREDVLAELDPADVAQFRQAFAAYGERLTLMDDIADIEPGIRYVPAPGHSPGHRAVLIESGNARLLHIADVIHLPIQLSALEIAAFDPDPDTAIATRRALVARAESENLMLMAYHFPFPGVGYVGRQGDLLTWEPSH